MRSEKRCKTQKPLIKSYGCAFFWDVLTNEKKDGFVVSSRPCVFFSFKKFLFWPGVFKRTGALRVLSHNPGMAFSQSFNIRLWSKEKKYQTPLKEKKGSRTLKQPMPVCPWADSFPSGLKGYSLIFFFGFGKNTICLLFYMQSRCSAGIYDLECHWSWSIFCWKDLYDIIPELF